MRIRVCLECVTMFGELPMSLQYYGGIIKGYRFKDSINKQFNHDSNGSLAK